MIETLTAGKPVISARQNNLIPFSEFIDNLKTKMKLVFHTRADFN